MRMRSSEYSDMNYRPYLEVEWEEFVRFSQSDSRWGDDDYDKYIKKIVGNDTTYHTIGAKGCALTCMAMVLRACGVDTDPGRLNTWLIDNEGFWGTAVIWSSINNYPNNDKVEYADMLGKGLENGITLPFSSIDPYLRNCHFIVAQVKNPDTNNQHWIIIKEKENGEYKIVDPSTKNRTTLNDYGNKVYRTIIYKK